MFARCTNKDVLTGSDFHVYEAIFAHRRAETCRSQAQNKHVFLRLEGHHKSPKQLRGDLNQCELRCSPKLQRPKVLPIPHLYSCHPILLMFVCVRPGFGLGSFRPGPVLQRLSGGFGGVLTDEPRAKTPSTWRHLSASWQQPQARWGRGRGRVGAGSGSHSRKPLIAQALLASERCSFPARQQRATVEAAFRD